MFIIRMETVNTITNTFSFFTIENDRKLSQMLFSTSFTRTKDMVDSTLENIFKKEIV